MWISSAAFVAAILLGQTAPETTASEEAQTATKTARSASAVASIVEVITAKQIRQRGYRHLADLINDLPDNHVDRSNWGIGEPLSQNVGFGYRFDTGQNIMILFNGQRLNAFLPGNRFGGEEYLLENIERVEIIRGPGSALYGANAFTAVVNIISRSSLTQGEDPHFTASAGGVLNARGGEGRASWITPVGSEGMFSGALRFAREDGQEIFVRNGLFGDQSMRDGVEHALSGDVFFSLDKLRVYGTFNKQRRDTFTGFNGMSPASNDHTYLGMWAYSLGADYAFSLSERVELKISGGGHADNWTEVARIPFFADADFDDEFELDRFAIDGQGADTLTLDLEAQVTWNYLASNNIVLGLNVSNDRVLGARRPTEFQIDPPQFVEFQTFEDDANNWLFDSDATRTTLGAYAQIDYDLGEHVFLNAGGRVDQYVGTGALDETFTEFSPRAGVVFKQDQLGNLKVLYGRATRVPNGFETLSAVAILGDPDNRPERINMVQGAWTKNWSDAVSTELGGFWSTISNRLLTDADVSDDLRAQGFVGQFINAGGDDPSSSGVNGRVTLKVSELGFAANFTRLVATDDGTGNDIAYIPRTMVNARVNVPVWWLNLSLGANYRADFSQPDGAIDPRAAIGDYVQLAAVLSFEPPALPLRARLGGQNLTDQNIRYPSSSLDFTRHFPARGLDIWGDVTYTHSF